MIMSPDGSLENTILSHNSNWHSIRPWAPSLSLAVREITSVSATFILSSTLSAEFDSSLASIGLEAAEEHSENGQDSLNGNSAALMLIQRKNNSVIADALAKGLSVNVNGSAWPRAFIRIDDQLDEAVIIIYALMPGRQYDIELGLPSAGQPGTIRRQVTTEGDPDQDAAENNTDPESPTPDNSTSSSDPHSTPSTSPSRTVPGTPPASTPQVTLEDRLSQLQHSLAAVNLEQETLITSLKSARRDAQKADSALRSEIETLKRTSEKNTAAEIRGKQKLLALQESVKRAHNSTAEMEETVQEIRAGFAELNQLKDKKEAEYAKIKVEAERAKKDRQGVEEKERKRLESMRAELAGLSNKLEKLGSKKDKLENTILPDLEVKLEEISKEVGAEDMEIARMEEEENQIMIQNEMLRSLNNEQLFDDISPSYVPLQRTRQHPTGDKPAPIGRPAPAPIQRPPHFDVPSSTGSSGLSQSTSSNPLWSPPLTNRQPQSQSQHTHHHAQNQSHSPRSQSFNSLSGPNHSAPMLPLSTPRRGSLKSTPANASAPSISLANISSSGSYLPLHNTTNTSTSSPTSSSINSSPTRTSPGMSAATSTLSSRAPAFEPSRSVINGAGNFYGHTSGSSNTTATPPGLSLSGAGLSVQRPRGTSLGNSKPPAPSGGSNNGSHGYLQWSELHGSGPGNSSFDNSR